MVLKKGKRSTRERGQGLVEYALILALAAVAVIAVGIVFGDSVRKQYCEIVWSVDPGMDAPGCNVIDVQCIVISTSPFRMRADVNDHAGEDDIEYVDFFIDGKPSNKEFYVPYCLINGDGPCTPYYGKGEHTFSAVAHDAESNTGKCEIKRTLP